MKRRIFLFELKPEQTFSVVFINDKASLECTICQQQHNTFSSISNTVHNMFEKYDLVTGLETYTVEDWKSWAAYQIIQYNILLDSREDIIKHNIFLLKKEHNSVCEIIIFGHKGTSDTSEPDMQPLVDRINKLKAFW